MCLKVFIFLRAQSTNNNPLLNMLPRSHYAQKIFGTQRTINTANGHLLETDPGKACTSC